MPKKDHTTRISRLASKMQAQRSKTFAPNQSAGGRSRATNGRLFFEDLDCRTPIYRRYRDVIALIVTDQGGVERMAEARLQLIRRFAASAVMAEMLEARLVSGEAISVEEHALVTSSLVRVAQRIGIGRRCKEIVPTLTAYLSHRGDEADHEPESNGAEAVMDDD